MEKISESISKLITDTAGGLLAFWSVFVYMIIKFFQFLGSCMAEGAINRALSKMMPSLEKSIERRIAPIEMDIHDIKELLPRYKSEKHNLKGENVLMREAILNNDKEVLDSIREAIKNEKK